MGAAASHSAAGGGLPASLNSFGDALLDKLAAEAKPGNAGTFISPYGISQALAMVLNGADPGGLSFAQLAGQVFRRGGGGSAAALQLGAVNEELRQLDASLVKAPSANLTVSDANSAWLAPRYALQPAYAEALKGSFGAEAKLLEGAKAVNDWVAAATQGKIKDIVDEGAVRQATLILINALYFKGLWQHQFEAHRTHPHDFYLLEAAAAPLQAAMMFHTFKDRSAVQVAANLPAVAANGAAFECAAVNLPYRGGEFAAVAAVPLGEWAAEPAAGGQRALAAAGGALPYPQALAACRKALLAHLPGAGGPHWQVLPGTDVKVFLPRFEVEFSATLNEALQALGITQPFKGGDLTRIALDADGRPVGDLAVSDVIHKVYCKVDEEGTEAAAATAVMMMRCAAVARPRPELTLKFDRPFVFAVAHQPSGAVLFCGEVHRPEAWRAA